MMEVPQLSPDHRLYVPRAVLTLERRHAMKRIPLRARNNCSELITETNSPHNANGSDDPTWEAAT